MDHARRQTTQDTVSSRLTVATQQEKRLSTSSTRRSNTVQPTLVVSEAPSLSAPAYLPVVSTAAEARSSALASARMTRARTSASGDEGAASFDESKLKVHSGREWYAVISSSTADLMSIPQQPTGV